MRKKKLFFGILIGLFLINFAFAVDNETDYTDEYEFDVSVSGENLDVVKTDAGAKFTFGDAGSLIVGDNKFENIELSSDKSLSEVEVGVDGSVVSASFVVDENGGEFNINGVRFDAPAGAVVNYDKVNGVSISVNPGMELDFISDVPVGEKIRVWGSNLILPNGHNLESGVIFRDSEGWYLDVGDKFVVDGVSVNKMYDKTRVYFDDVSHGDESYISFGKDIFSFAGNIKADFKKGNKYVKIEEGDVFSINGLGVDLKSKVILEKNSEGIVPTLTAFGDIEILQDSKSIFSLESEILLSDAAAATSTPMKIAFKNFGGGPLTGKFVDGFDLQAEKVSDNYELFVDNFNRFAMIPKDSADDFSVKYEGIDTKFSARVSYNYVTERELDILTGDKINPNLHGQFYRGSIGNIKVDVAEGEKSMMLGRVRDYWNTLTDETRESVEGIYLVNQDFFNQADNSDSKAFYYPVDKSLYFRAEHFKEDSPAKSLLDFSLFRHESGHALTDKYNSKSLELAMAILEADFGMDVEKARSVNQDLRKKIKEIDSEIASLGSSGYDEFRRKSLEDEKISYVKEREDVLVLLNKLVTVKSDFELEWEGSGYIGNQGDAIGFEDKDSYPKNGLVSRRGGYNWREDISEYIERVNDPEFFADLINPNKKDTYSLEYARKLKFLNDNKFITDLEYGKILEAAGLK